MSKPKELLPESLYHKCDPEIFKFKTTDELPELEKVLGQPRALSALELGCEVTGPGFNIYVSGLPDSGRTTLTRDYINRKAEKEPVPPDWCYVNNFENPYRPRTIQLSQGKASVFKEELKELIDRCRQEIQSAFLSEEYINERNNLTKTSQDQQEEVFKQLKETARESNFTILRTTSGYKIIPTVKGKPLSPAELDQLSEENQRKLEDLQETLEKGVIESVQVIREIAEKYHQEVEKLDVYTSRYAIDHLIKAVKAKFSGINEVLEHIDSIEIDIIENTEKFLENDKKSIESPWMNRYGVNVLVDNSELEGAPVIIEGHPTYQNLFGRIDHHLIMGVSRTDFMMVRPGAFHKANGGYLLLPAQETLLNPYAWQGMKRTLRDGEIRILELGSQMSLISSASLEPEAIPLSIKVIFFGTPKLHELLRNHDVDFEKLFKIRAEFATLMDWTDENTLDYALFIKSVIVENHLLPFGKTAIARVIEHSSRMTGDQQKLSTQFGKISDLVREAAYWAHKTGKQKVTAEQVDRAIEEREYRHNLSEELIQDRIKRETILIDVSGKAVGQTNALSIQMTGDYLFGRPSRVTASVSPGNKGIIDIEKQADLGGPIHTKGVLIISGFLGRRFGQNKPINLTARVTFEQSYSGVEGDSASLAEISALLSAISDIPLRQDLALTGSINQLGNVQAVGGINKKIEGFYATCKNKGITGSQGVIIPHTNQSNLMLKKEIVESVKLGKFHIWPVTDLDEAIWLLAGIPPGELQANGSFPDGTFNKAVNDRITLYKKLVEKKGEGI